MVRNNRNVNRKMSAKEEVIADTIESIRKRIIQIQLECEFAEKFMVENPTSIIGEAGDRLNESINLMKKEEIALIAKLNFYKEKRTDVLAKKAMKGYNKFPKTINMDSMFEVEENN